MGKLKDYFNRIEFRESPSKNKLKAYSFKTRIPLKKDFFGLGFYDEATQDSPFIFTSLTRKQGKNPDKEPAPTVIMGCILDAKYGERVLNYKIKEAAFSPEPSFLGKGEDWRRGNLEIEGEVYLRP